MANTMRLGLPLLVAGQAQKEMFHNEALTLLDGLVSGCVEVGSVNVPPASPAAGEMWVVGSAPSGDFAGQAGAIALMTAGGWRFVIAPEGTMLTERGSGRPVVRLGGQWITGRVQGDELWCSGQKVVGARAGAIAAPAGGTTIDSQARTAIAAILAAMRGHGLIAP